MMRAENVWKLDLGATVVDGGEVLFRVWAPHAKEVSVRILNNGAKEGIPLKEDRQGYFAAKAYDVFQGARYFYILDHGTHYPDPASRFQPEGVHGPSQIINPGEFLWEDAGWKGVSQDELIIYEVHTGTFTAEGTFQAIIPHLDYLKELGITALELMPVAQFPGNRNWGYDGVYPYAPQNSYGGPTGLKSLINAAHRKGLSLILDVVYNHFGPEGNYLHQYGPYFTDRYRTPWGDAVNFDGPYSDEVRHFFVSNALYWLNEYHIDGLRLDAVHGIYDFSARHFLEELSEAVHEQARYTGRNMHVIVESDLNDTRVLNPPEIGGFNIDAQWNDDFHHALHALITGEKTGYYQDFGTLGHLKKAVEEGFVYSGQYSRFRKRRHGNSSKARPSRQLIVFSQSHDQVGNRCAGDRLSTTQTLEKLKLCAGIVVLSPYLPLFFMGEEYGEKAPFLYFVSHTEEALAEAVRRGRREEFASFGWKGEVPDPQSESTFVASRLDRELRYHGSHKILFEFYRELIRLRKEIPSLSSLIKENMEVKSLGEERALMIRRWFSGDETFSLFNFGEGMLTVTPAPLSGIWDNILESSAGRWGGTQAIGPPRIECREPHRAITLAPYSFILFRKTEGGE